MYIGYKSKFSEMTLSGYASMLGWNDASKLNRRVSNVYARESSTSA